MLSKFFVILIFFLVPFFLWADQEIEWSPSRFAKSYKIEIREFESKKVKVDTKVKTTKYKVNKLKPGLYEYRIGIIDNKDVIVISSDWSSISIIQSFEPEAAVDEIYYGGKDEKFQELFITGNNFMEDMEVEVYSPKGKIPIKNYIRLNDKEFKLTLDLTNAKTGNYSLKLTNPLKKVFVKDNFYILGQTRKEAEKKIEEATRISQGEEMEYTPNRKYFYNSMLVPGLGQYKSGVANESSYRKLRGGFYLLTFLGTSVYLAVQYKDYQEQNKKTQEINTLNYVVNYPFAPPISILGIYMMQEFNKNVSLLYNQWDSVNNTAFALVSIYLLNLIDAYFFTGDYKKEILSMDKIYQNRWKAYILPEHNGSLPVGRMYGIEYSIRF